MNFSCSLRLEKFMVLFCILFCKTLLPLTPDKIQFTIGAIRQSGIVSFMGGFYE